MGSVDDHLMDLSPDRREATARVVDVALGVAPDAEQGVSYGMAALRVAGKPLLGFAESAHHLAIYPFSPAVVAAVKDELEGFSLSKGTIRYTPDRPIPTHVVERIVELRVSEIRG
ncbi:MAG: DUF1801 domain-containing protein [Acidimicrobiia bacterium]|nr:DUF1801 domain-containing protein [Acidimicrobiia bacterium]